jgi:hypothetical protein
LSIISVMELEHWSGSSKHLETHPEITNGSGSSKHSETHPEVLDGSRSSKQYFEIHPYLIVGRQSSRFVETHVEVSDGSGRSKHSEAHSNVIDRISSSKHSETHADVIDGSDSFRHSSIHQEDAVNDQGDPHTLAKRLGPSSSSSSSDLSLEDLVQIDKNEIHKSGAQIASFPDPDEDSQRALKDESDISSNRSSISEEKDNVSPGPTSTSQVSDITHELVAHGMPLTQSPQIQVMDQSGGYDPDRIPSSVFAISKSTTPMEWSVASNESLFSIHIGNNSFSKESIMLSPHPPVPVAATDTENIKIGKEQSGATVVADETVKDAERVSAQAKSEENLPTPTSLNSSSLSHHSDGSGISARSFAFPK